MLSSIRRFRFHILVLFLAFVWILVPAGAASAHGVEVLKSDPADGAVLAQPPAQVRVWFSEEARSGESTLQVLDSKGARVYDATGGVDLDDPDHASMKVDLPPLPDGAYVVKWHVALTDGDTSDGQFQFSVGNASSSVSSYPPPGSSPKVEAVSQNVSAQSSYPPPGESATRLAAYPAPKAASVSAPNPTPTPQTSRWLAPAIIVAILLLVIAVGLGIRYLRRIKQPGF